MCPLVCVMLSLQNCRHLQVGLFGGLKGAYYDGTCVFFLCVPTLRCTLLPLVQHLLTTASAAFGRVVATRVDVINFAWTSVPVTYCMADFFRSPHVSLWCIFARVAIAFVVAVCDARCSVRWSGSVFPNYAGTGQVRQPAVGVLACFARQHATQVYTFRTTTTTAGDEGVRLWVDGQLLIDAWATSRLSAVLLVGSLVCLLLF